MTKRQVRLVDSETGVVVVTDAARVDNEQTRRTERAWVMRWRANYRRRTGHSLRVEEV